MIFNQSICGLAHVQLAPVYQSKTKNQQKPKTCVRSAQPDSSISLLIWSNQQPWKQMTSEGGALKRCAGLSWYKQTMLTCSRTIAGRPQYKIFRVLHHFSVYQNNGVTQQGPGFHSHLVHQLSRGLLGGLRKALLADKTPLKGLCNSDCVGFGRFSGVDYGWPVPSQT